MLHRMYNERLHKRYEWYNMIIIITIIIIMIIKIMIITIIIIILGGGQPLCVGVPSWENVERPTRDGLTPPLQVPRWSLSWSLMINYHGLWWIIIMINDLADDAKLWKGLEQNFDLQGLWVRGWWPLSWSSMMIYYDHWTCFSCFKLAGFVSSGVMTVFTMKVLKTPGYQPSIVQ